MIQMQATLDVQQEIIQKSLVNRHSLVLIKIPWHNWLLVEVSKTNHCIKYVKIQVFIDTNSPA